EIPRTLSALIMRCLAKDPAARPQSADEILHELDSMTMPMGVTPQAGGIRAPTQKRSWSRVAAVAILFVVLAGVGYAVTRPRTPDAPVVVPVAAPTPPPAPVESIVKRAAAASSIVTLP